MKNLWFTAILFLAMPCAMQGMDNNAFQSIAVQTDQLAPAEDNKKSIDALIQHNNHIVEQSITTDLTVLTLYNLHIKEIQRILKGYDRDAINTAKKSNEKEDNDDNEDNEDNDDDSYVDPERIFNQLNTIQQNLSLMEEKNHTRISAQIALYNELHKKG